MPFRFPSSLKTPYPRWIVIAFSVIIAQSTIVHAQEKTHAGLGPVGQRLANACTVRNGQQYDLLATYATRIENPVAVAGCGAIGVYGALMEKGDAEEQVIISFENDIRLMQVASRLVAASPRFAAMLSVQPQDAEALVATLADIPASDKMLDDLARAIEHDWPRDIAPPDGPLVLSLALLLTAGSDNPAAIRTALNDIRRTIASPDLPLLAVLMQVSGMERVDTLIQQRLKDAKDVVSTLSRRAPGAIDLFRRTAAALRFAPMFLPPPQELFRNAQDLSDEEMQRLRHEYVETMAGAFAALAPNAGAVRTMIALDGLQGPVMDAISRYHNGNEIIAFLDDFARSNLFALIVASACGEEWQKRVRMLAWTFAPSVNCTNDVEDGQGTSEHKGVVICPTRPGWEGHLGRVGRWYAETPWAASFLTTTDSDAGLYVLQNLPRALEPFDRRTVERVGTVVAGLREDPALAGQLIVDLEEATDYLQWLQVAKDSEDLVVHNQDVKSGWTTQKSIYVLITSYPSQLDDSLIQNYNTSRSAKNIDLAQVSYLTAATVSDLSNHQFTKTDVAVHVIESTETLVDWASYAAVPITGGASITIVAARKSGITALKWAVHPAMTRSAATLKKLSGEGGTRVAIREWRNLLEQEKLGPGRPPTGSRVIRNSINSTYNHLQAIDGISPFWSVLGFIVGNRLGKSNELDTCKL